MSSSQRTGRTSRNQVFQVASASWARRAELPVSQRSAAIEGSDDTSVVEPGSGLSTSPSTSVEKRREGCEPLSKPDVGRPTVGGEPLGEVRRIEAVAMGETANVAKALGTNKGSTRQFPGDKSARLGRCPQAPHDGSTGFGERGRTAAIERPGRARTGW